MNYQPLFEQIKLHEGLRLHVYKCTGGANTIGYGFNLDKRAITEEIAEQLMYLVLADIEESLEKHNLLGAKHGDARRAVLINMAYQMGVNGLLMFRNAISAYRMQDYETCASEMLDSKWATQTPARAQVLAEQMRKGEYQ